MNTKTLKPIFRWKIFLNVSVIFFSCLQMIHGEEQESASQWIDSLTKSFLTQVQLSETNSPLYGFKVNISNGVNPKLSEDVINYHSASYQQFMRGIGYDASNRYSRFAVTYILNQQKVTGAESLNQKVQLINTYLSNQLGLQVDKKLLTPEIVIDDMFRNPDEWESILKKNATHLSFDQLSYMASVLGERFLAFYNHPRARDEGDTIDRTVTMSEMIKSYNQYKLGGVCRDVAFAQAQLFKAAGMKAYILTYRTASAYHATAVAQNPNDKNAIVKFNYGDTYSSDGKGSSLSLRQDSSLPNVGLAFSVFDQDGKFVESVPTEVGGILLEELYRVKQTTGLDADKHSIVFNSKYLTMGAFNAQTSSNEDVKGSFVKFHYILKYFQIFEYGFERGIGNLEVKNQTRHFSFHSKGKILFQKVHHGVTLIDDGQTKVGAKITYEGEVWKGIIQSASNDYLIAPEIDFKEGHARRKGSLNIEHRLSSGNGSIQAQVNENRVYEFAHPAEAKQSSVGYRLEGREYMVGYTGKFLANTLIDLGLVRYNGAYGGHSTRIDGRLISPDGADQVFATKVIPDGRSPSFFKGQQRVFNLGYCRTLDENGSNICTSFARNQDAKNNAGRVQLEFRGN